MAETSTRPEPTENAWVARSIDILWQEFWGTGAPGVEDPRYQIDAEDASFDDSLWREFWGSGLLSVEDPRCQIDMPDRHNILL